jgi:hypothetical protein
MNVPFAIAIKLVSVLLLAVMSALIRAAGSKFPLGEIVFFRSAFAVLPVFAIYAARGQLLAVVRTERPFGHLGRGFLGIASMFLNFAALTRLPLMDATAISFAAPLITVVLAAIVLNEHCARLPLVGGEAWLRRDYHDAMALSRYLEPALRRFAGAHDRSAVRHGGMLHQCRYGHSNPPVDRQ